MGKGCQSCKGQGRLINVDWRHSEVNEIAGQLEYESQGQAELTLPPKNILLADGHKN